MKAARVIGVLLVLTLVVDVAVVVRPRQVRAYLTHWQGAPSHVEPYGPWPSTDGPRLLIAVAGDVGDSGDRLDRTAAALDALDGRHPYDVLLLLGDNVYPAGDPTGLERTVFAPFASVLRHARLLAILGNHDVADGVDGDAQVAALGLPGRWWAETYGDVLVVGLDSTRIADDDQAAFLEDALRASAARWKIVALHHPPYSAGYQGSSLRARARFGPVFERFGVQLVLSGHDHDYQRSEVIAGTTYVVSGAASGTRRTSSASFTATSFSWHHFVEVAVFDDQIVLRAINQDGDVADEAVIGP
jgi:hypothetical protein